MTFLLKGMLLGGGHLVQLLRCSLGCPHLYQGAQIGDSVMLPAAASCQCASWEAARPIGSLPPTWGTWIALGSHFQPGPVSAVAGVCGSEPLRDSSLICCLFLLSLSPHSFTFPKK